MRKYANARKDRRLPDRTGMLKGYSHTLRASCFGYITQAIVNNYVALLFIVFRDTFGIRLERITLLITVNFCVQLTVDVLAAKLADIIGYRRCIIAAHLFSAAGLVGLAVFPYVFGNALAGLLLSVTMYAVGGGIIEVLVSPIVEFCPMDNKSSVMSLLHSFYCWGTVGVILISTLFLWAFGRDSWRVLACIWALLPLLNSVYFSKVPLVAPAAEGKGTGLKQLLSSGVFRIFIILMMTAGASELSMSQWASAFAETGLGISKAAGDIAGPCLFAALMGCSRVFYAKCGDKINLLNFIFGSSVLCVISYLIAALSPWPAVSLAGCALCGLSVGVMWPGILSISASKFSGGGTAMFAVLALAGDMGCSLGPTAVGVVSGLLGDNLKTGLLCAALFPAVPVICTLIYKRMLRRGESYEE